MHKICVNPIRIHIFNRNFNPILRRISVRSTFLEATYLKALLVTVYQLFFIEQSIGCDWTGTTEAETLYCCSSANGSQCGIQEGNCYSDDECFMHLKCGMGNCKDLNPLSDFPIGSNCCYDPNSSKMKKEWYSGILIQLRSHLANSTTYMRHFFFSCFLIYYINLVVLGRDLPVLYHYCNYIQTNIQQTKIAITKI